MPAQKRAYDDPVGPATPAPAGSASSSSGRTRPDKKSRRQQRRKEKQAAAPTLPLNSNGTSTPRSTKDADLEEGEVVEGDFSDLFVVDTTPAAVRPKDRFLGEQSASTPLKGSKEPQGDVEDLVTLPMAAAEGKELVPEETKEAREDAAALDSDDAMRIFAQEMAMTDDSDDDDVSDDDDDEDASDEEGDEFGGAAGQGLMLYDDEDELQKVIQGRIVDDSAAPTTGRYYKEADLTKTCVLCGEHGHSSRDCTHSQCFICGAIDTDHEARNCPVALVCSACGSRGHFARDCPIAPGARGSYGQRCSRCGSSNHGAPNCPSQWRVYDTSGPKPPKRKVVLACANCGSGKDHFIDDCMMPRGHPMKHADPSAFNRGALGAAASSLPVPSAGPSSSSRRRGGATGKLDMRPRVSAYEDDAGDDDWFASRSRGGGGGGGGGGSAGRDRNRGSGGGGGSRGQQPPPPPPLSFRNGGSGGGGGRGDRATHIHFSETSRNRYDPSASASRSSGGAGNPSSADRRRDRDYYDPDRDYSSGGRNASGGGGRGASSSGYDSPRQQQQEDWRSLYGSGGGDRDRDRSRASAARGPRSLLERVGGGGGGGRGGGGGSAPSSRSQTPTQQGGGGRRGPSYRGGYV
ncbi:hypothetical protein C6P46_001888 [Rhodotorula mucilaginosa]|uniref:CCHC-type domain-containing protein n=1 Tax=Rhodotorula mucilaginosa TaxID=5537 RepID=A0A9P6W544_RHOMI|nr:hypothetical protein C6P46_001888 [Rhodotorula mucilaginosa]TKA56469.1 hypothetical protein B0A53_02040 [Rhodotorula sp. CCFEE 5036]